MSLADAPIFYIGYYFVDNVQRMTPLNWMLLNLACSDGAIAGFGCVYIGLQPGHTLITYPISQEINVTYIDLFSFE
jgi:c-opsin